MHEPVKSIVQEGINGAQLYSLGHTQRRMVRAVKSAAGFLVSGQQLGSFLEDHSILRTSVEALSSTGQLK